VNAVPKHVATLEPDTEPAGLSSDDAKRRLQKDGPNAIAQTTIAPWRGALGKFWAPVPWMLELAIVLQIALGAYVEGAVIAALLIFNAALGFFQEGRAQATLDALKSQLALIASVRRDSVWKEVPAADLVTGDIVKLSLGAIVGADVRLISGSVLLDQAMLTGESLPVEAGPDLSTFAGALVRRGEATGEVIATGARTKFGKTADLVRTAHAVSSQQKAVMGVVRNLAIFNVVVVVAQVVYAALLKLPVVEIIPLALTSILAAIPVALPATFTLASALAARVLAKKGVLPTRLSAVDEAGSMDVLCTDKTGTLTQNQLAVTAVRAMSGFDEKRVLALAALASSEGGQDPVDTAIRSASLPSKSTNLPRLAKFTPFDPANKMSEATATESNGQVVRIVKGAFATVSGIVSATPAALTAANDFLARGFRVLAVAAGPPRTLEFAGLIALSDPPRTDSAALVAGLDKMGVRTVMLTGDAPATAAIVARAVGLAGAVCPPGTPLDSGNPAQFAVFAGVFPEDKFSIVKSFQKAGHTVGMCGDGANDAPALRQAQMGIAVSTATDVAKSAAGIVLTQPGLGGIVAAVTEGRVTFQRILTYTLRSVTRKIDQMLFLTVGLVMTGHAILTPLLMVILMSTGDFLAMSSTTDNVRPSAKPNSWRINNLTVAGTVLGVSNLAFCSAILAIGKYRLNLDIKTLQTLAAVTLVFSGQSVFYVVRDRQRIWSSRPSRWVFLSSLADVSIITCLATGGYLMAALPVGLIAGILGAAIAFAFVLDIIKVAVFARLKMA
jgi:H+-transporting ATPase